MEHHPIESLMKTAMENLKEMVDVNKIVGDAVETPDGSVIIPISRVSFGFAAGGTEFEHQAEGNGRNSPAPTGLPFGGGSGGGVMVQPVAFLVAGQGQVGFSPSITTPCSIGSSISPPSSWRRSRSSSTDAANTATAGPKNMGGGATARSLSRKAPV